MKNRSSYSTTVAFALLEEEASARDMCSRESFTYCSRDDQLASCYGLAATVGYSCRAEELQQAVRNSITG